MNFSNELIDRYKEASAAKSDAATAANVPNMTRMNLSAIRKGERHLTEEQALWLARECGIDEAVVLVELAAETSRSEKAKSVWMNLSKKLKAAAIGTAVAAFLMISGTSGHIPPQRSRSIR